MPPVRPRLRRAYPATFGLLEAPDSVEAQSRKEPDGYGIGSFDKEGQPHVIRRAKAAYEDRAFPQEAHELRSRHFVAHIRFATNGENLERNTHPFTQQRPDLRPQRRRPRARSARGAAAPAVPRADRRRDRLRARLRADHAGDRRPRRRRHRGHRRRVDWIAATLPLYAVNILLADDDELWALRYPETHDLLWLDEREAPVAEHRDRRRRLRFGVDEPAPGIAVASEAMGDGPELDAARSPVSCCTSRADLTPTVTTVLPDPPAHPLTLEDLGIHAAAAQNEK